MNNVYPRPYITVSRRLKEGTEAFAYMVKKQINTYMKQRNRTYSQDDFDRAIAQRSPLYLSVGGVDFRLYRI